MTSRTLIGAAVVAAFGFAGAAQAQQQDHHRHDWRGEAQGPHQQQQWRGERPRQWQQSQQWQQRQYVAPQRDYGYNPYRGGYAAAPQYRSYSQPRYYAGGYAPYAYRARPYWVDWRSRGLYAPPYGYQWVQADTGEVLLIALATGLIANAIIGGY